MATLEESLQAIPLRIKELKENQSNLMQVANYCRDMNAQQPNKAQALTDTKGYALQALTSVAYQVHLTASLFNDFLNLQQADLQEQSAELSTTADSVAASHDMVGRAALGDFPPTSRAPFTPKVSKLPEPVIKVNSRPNRKIDFSVYDDIGLGSKERVRSSTFGAQGDPAAASRASNQPGVLTFKKGTVSRASGAPMAAQMVGTPSPTTPVAPSMGAPRVPAPPPPPPPQAPSVPQAQTVQAIYDYTAASPEEISISAGEIIRVSILDAGDGWMEGQNSRGQKGLFPASYVELM